jgi:hypothetical protein
MSFTDELEGLISAELADPKPDIQEIIEHAVRLGRAREIENQKIRSGIQTYLDEGFNPDCSCFHCARSNAYRKILKWLYSQVDSIINEQIFDETLFTVSTKSNLETSVLIPKNCQKYGIELSDVKPVHSHPHYIQVIFNFTEKLSTECLLRDLPNDFSVIIDGQTSLGFSIFTSSYRFMEAIKEITFLEESKLVRTSALKLSAFYESLADHIEG